MIKHNSKKRFYYGLLVSLVLILSVKIIFSQSSTNYKLIKSVVDQAGAPSQSTNHKLVDAIGQSSPLGSGNSSNFKEGSGFLLNVTPPTGVPIDPVAASPQAAGSEFWVDVVVGTNAKPASNLFGVSFDVNFTNITYIDVVTPYASNVIVGDFLGSDLVFFYNVDETAGKVNVGISRKAGAGGVNGFGTMLKIKFKAAAGTPNNTPIQFCISNVSANDPVGSNIPFVPGSVTVDIGGSIIVWPGDTNNDGIVNQKDILPIGLYWGQTGLPRVCHPLNQEIIWIAHSATPWTPLNATYANANGDGIVNQTDVLPIGLNWGKTHTGHFAGQMMKYSSTPAMTDTSTITLKCSGSTNPGQHFYLDVLVKKIKDLFGLSFELYYSPTSFVDSLKVEEGAGNILGNELIFFPVVNVGSDTGKVSVGISRKFGQGGITADSGFVTRINLKMRETAVINQDTTLFWFENIFANDQVGNTIAFKTEKISLKLVTGKETNIKEEIKAELPVEFILGQNYPNPFNPSTIIQYALPGTGHVRLVIYDLLGRSIKTLIDAPQPAGLFQAIWDATNEQNQAVAAGVYFCHLRVSDPSTGSGDGAGQEFVKVIKLVLIK